MGILRRDSRVLENLDPALPEQNVPHNRPLQVASLDEHPSGPHPGDAEGGLNHPVEILDRLSAEFFRLRDVGCNQVGFRNKKLRKDLFGLRLQQGVPASGDHDRVDDQKGTSASERIGDLQDRVLRSQHSGFDGFRLEIAANGLQLGTNHLPRNGEDRRNPEAVLGWQCRQGARAEDPQRRERFEVRLDTCPTARIASGDGQSDSPVDGHASASPKKIGGLPEGSPPYLLAVTIFAKKTASLPTPA